MDPLSFPVVEVSGGPRERGRTYGEVARPLIEQAIGFYEQAFGHQAGLTWTQVTDIAQGWLPHCESFAPDLVEEMAGVAEGSGRSLADILALNARGEIIYDRTFHTMGAAQEDHPIEGCTSFALLGEATADGHVYCGQNWDWRDGVRPTVMVLRIVQPPRPTVLMHVEAGQIGRQGANSAGLALNANGLGGRFDDSVGVPQTLIRRRVLDSPSLCDALRVLTRTQQHIASNALITHRDGIAIDMETTPGAHGWMYPTDGLLVHGNHYQAFIPPQLAATHRPSPVDSLYRVPRAEQGLARCREAADTSGVRKQVREAMSDHVGYPESVCTHPDHDMPSVMRWSTLLSSCVDLTTGDYLITSGQPCRADYELLPWNLYDGPGA
ncbi:MAG: C45 family autoproteolytic acyltransferase/hydrolase [Haloechinothrix sp.]